MTSTKNYSVYLCVCLCVFVFVCVRVCIVSSCPCICWTYAQKIQGYDDTCMYSQREMCIQVLDKFLENMLFSCSSNLQDLFPMRVAKFPHFLVRLCQEQT